MNNKTIIYSPSYGIWGGGQIYIEQLCVYMNRQGIQTCILTAETDAFDCPTEKMEMVLSKKKRLITAIQIARKYKKEGVRTIILNDLASLWLAPIFKLYGFKVISLLHLYLRKKEGDSLGHSKVEYNLLKYSVKFCNKIFSVNKNNAEVFGKKNVIFTGNYVPKWFMNVPRKDNSKKYDFILIARFSVEKNILLFLELLSELNARGERSYTALLVGEGPEKDRIEQCIYQKDLTDTVTLQGWVERSELPSVYDKGKCFVISSYHEGFATTLLEAHARGLPAIVTRSSGFCVEFIEGYNTKTGIIFEAKDLKEQDFYNLIEKLINTYKIYDEACIKKAGFFSEKNVLTPIIDAVKEI